MASSPADLESKDGSTATAVGTGLIRKAFVPQVVKIADTIDHYKPVRVSSIFLFNSGLCS